MILQHMNVTALMALLVCGLGCSYESAESLYSDAQQHVRDGELSAAVTLYQKIIAEYPDTPAAERAQKGIMLYRDLDRIEQNFPIRQAKDKLIETGRAVLLYQSRKGRWPERLGDLTPDYLRTEALDPWGRQLVYMVKRDGKGGFLLASLGSDGATGGSGEAIDMFIEDGRLVDRPSVNWP